MITGTLIDPIDIQLKLIGILVADRNHLRKDDGICIVGVIRIRIFHIEDDFGSFFRFDRIPQCAFSGIGVAGYHITG